MTNGTLQGTRTGRGKTSSTAWLAWALAGLCVAMFAASAVLGLAYLGGGARASSGWGASTMLVEMVLFSLFLAFPIVGALIASRRPRNPIGWICLTVGLLWMSTLLQDSYASFSPGSERDEFSVAVAALGQAGWIPQVVLPSIYMVLLFPDGRLPARRWRPLVWFSTVVIVLIALGITLSPGPLEGYSPEVRNPFGLEGQRWIEYATLFVLPMLPLCMMASAASLVVRYRRGGAVVREQIKWLAFSVSLIGVAFLANAIGLLLTTDEAATPLWLGILQQSTLALYAGVPIAVGFAILRYRLYDIEVIINRTLVYGSLTATLLVVYFGAVAAMQALLDLLAPGRELPQLAIVASTLAIAAFFNPLRRRIQSTVDRRFYRSRYDAAKTLHDFSDRLRNETDLDALQNDLTVVITRTMQPEHVRLWLKSQADARKA